MAKKLSRTELKVIAAVIASKIAEEVDLHNWEILNSDEYKQFEENFPQNHRLIHSSFDTAIKTLKGLCNLDICVEFQEEFHGSYSSVESIHKLLVESARRHIEWEKKKTFKLLKLEEIKIKLFPKDAMLRSTRAWEVQTRTIEDIVLDELTIQQLREDIDIDSFLENYVSKLSKIIDA